MGVSDPPAAQTHTEWAYAINQHSQRRKLLRPPLCPTCGRYWRNRGRRRKKSPVLPGQEKQLESTWEDKDEPLNPCHVDDMLLHGVCRGPSWVGTGSIVRGESLSPHTPPNVCLSAVRYLRQ